MKHIMMKLGSLACALALAAGAFVGCSVPSASTDNAQQDNRTYMSQVNGVMNQLGEKLDSFVDAVSRGDLVNMRTQADNAYTSLDELSALEAPEGLSDVRQQYLDGTAKLREALDGFITLYTEIEGGSFDQSTYASRISQVQSLYDEGVNLLKQADQTAVGK